MKTLIIPDIHQNTKWADYILYNHENEVDEIVFLGDYFDTHRGDKVSSFEETCEWCNETHSRLGDKAHWLFGNHDLAYMASHQFDFPIKLGQLDSLFRFYCSGIQDHKFKVFKELISIDFLNSLKLAYKTQGYWCVHAGFSEKHLPPHLKSANSGVEQLVKQWDECKSCFVHTHKNNWITHIGSCRMGYHDVGSPVWLDWKYEFEAVDGLKQIVGHTSSNDKKLRAKGQNYAVDYNQSLYGMLEDEVFWILGRVD